MTLIDLGEFKLRFDPKEVRINIDGELIDIGARRDEDRILPEINEGPISMGLFSIYPESRLIDHPDWKVDTMVLSPDGKERTYVHKRNNQRLTTSELKKILLGGY